MIPSYVKRPKSYKIIDADGNLIDYFRTKSGALSSLPHFKKINRDSNLKVVENNDTS